MKPLSIVHTENSCGWGGQEIRILTEARGFLDRGHDVTLIAPAEAPIADAGPKLGLPVVRLDIRRKRAANLLALRRWLVEQRERIDILNTHSSTDSWLSALACTAIPAPPPIVRTRHVSTTIRNRPTTRWLYTRATAHIVTTGEALRRQLARDNGVPLDRMTSIPTGIDLGRFVPGDAPAARARLAEPPRPTLGIVATLRDWKGHDVLVRGARARSRRLERVEHLHRRRRSVSSPPRRQARGAGYCRHGPFRRPAGRRRTLAAGAWISSCCRRGARRASRRRSCRRWPAGYPLSRRPSAPSPKRSTMA